jgi:hypothetical protein
MAAECARAGVKRARHEWTSLRQPRMRQEPHRLVFLDETGTTTKMTRLRGRSKRGERLHAAAPFGHWGTQTFIAALRSDGLTAPWVLNGPMNREAFDIYVETQLAPTLHQGDVIRRGNSPPGCFLTLLIPRQPRRPQKRASRQGAQGTGRVVPVSAALLSRPEPHRNGILKAEGSPPKSRRPNHRRPLARRGRHLRPFQPRRMLELPQCRWIRARLNARSSNAHNLA